VVWFYNVTLEQTKSRQW